MAPLQAFHNDVCTARVFSHLEPEESETTGYAAHAHQIRYEEDFLPKQ